MASSLVNISLTLLLTLGLLNEFVKSQDHHDLVPPECVYTGNHLDCSRRKLKEVPKKFPPDVVKIDLSWNRLESINVSVFSNLTRLRIVQISHNRLKSVPPFKSNNITDLLLDHNGLTVLPLPVLSSLPSLRLLDLNSNKLASLPTFPNNTLIRLLYLNHNRISSLSVGCLDGLTQLEVLRFNRNKLKTINKNLFNKLSSLQTLELMRNDIETIDALSFKNLSKLRVLKLRKNKINHLADGAFWGLKSIEVLKLDYNNISSVEKGWLYGLDSMESLTLSHNSITRVLSIGWKFCKLLRQLDLRHNQLTTIKTENFNQLGKLHHLNLDNNNIRDIEIEAFVGLNTLESLQINYNEVRWNVEDMNGAFNGLTSLTRLGLKKNHITTIAANAFIDLKRLRSLDLSQNPIASVQSNAFAMMSSLVELRLNSSALMCDCNLAWLPVWLRENKFDAQTRGVCAHPAWLNGHNLFLVQPTQFKCDDVPKPVIISQPQSHVAIRGSDTKLECTVASSSNSPMQFQWRKEGVPIKDADVENFAQSDSSRLMNSTTILHMNEVHDQDEGEYQCVVTNQFGSTYSHRARITVHVLPSFTKRPTNVTVKAGNTARLECSATGHPTPQIVWQKDGGDDFPAAHERRMHVMPTDVVFFIVKVKAADSGVYSCIATSPAGRIVANATVQVLETPSFVKGMENKQVRARETAVLECLASGSPKPRLTWLKNDQPMEVTPRHFFTADGQLLIIVQTTYSDAGKYTCEMRNTLGTKSDSCVLDILAAAGAPPFMASLSDQSTMIGIIIIAVVCCVVGTSLVWVIIIYQTRRKQDEPYTPTPTDEVTIPMDLPSSSADSYPSLEKPSSRMSLHGPDSVHNMYNMHNHPIYSLSAVNLSHHLASEATDDSQQPFLRTSWLDHSKPLSASPPPHPPATVALVHSNSRYGNDVGCYGNVPSHSVNGHADVYQQPVNGHYNAGASYHSEYGGMVGDHGREANGDAEHDDNHHCCHGDAGRMGGYHGDDRPHDGVDEGGFCEQCAMMRDAHPAPDSPGTRQSTLRRQPISDQYGGDVSDDDVTTPLRTRRQPIDGQYGDDATTPLRSPRRQPIDEHYGDDVSDDVTTPLRTLSGEATVSEEESETRIDASMAGNNNHADVKTAPNGHLVHRTLDTPTLSHRTIV